MRENGGWAQRGPGDGGKNSRTRLVYFGLEDGLDRGAGREEIQVTLSLDFFSY